MKGETSLLPSYWLSDLPMLQNPARHNDYLGERSLEVLSLEHLNSRGKQRLPEDIGARLDNHPSKKTPEHFSSLSQLQWNPQRNCLEL